MQFINTWFIYILNLIQINKFFVHRYLFFMIADIFPNNNFHRTRQRSLVFNYAGKQTYLIAMRQCNKIAVLKSAIKRVISDNWINAVG